MKKIVYLLIVIIIALSSISCSKNEVINVYSQNDNIVEVESKRNIIISEISGNATVKHSDSDSLNAYEGMSLSDGDDVIVADGSSLVLDIDSDKHLFAEENTHFWVDATGKENNTKTIIHLESGSVMCDLINPLLEEEVFDVQTTSIVLGVRGTVFRVSVIKGKNDSVFDLVQVFEGKVYSNISETNEELNLMAGQCSIVDNNSPETGKPKYIHEEEIDKDFNERTGLNFDLQQAPDGEIGALIIKLEDLPVETLSRLVDISEEGRELCFETEELVEKKEAMELASKPHNHEYTVVNYVAPTCTSTGLKTVKCLICNETLTQTIAMAEHSPVTINKKNETCTEDGHTDGQKCSVCGTIIIPPSKIPAHGHNIVVQDYKKICTYCGQFFGYEGINHAISLDSNPTLASGINVYLYGDVSYSANFFLDGISIIDVNNPENIISDSNHLSSSIYVDENGIVRWTILYNGVPIMPQGDVDSIMNSAESINQAIAEAVTIERSS